MSGAVRAADRDRFRRLLANRLGLLFDDAKRALLDDVLRRRSEAARESAGAYLSRLERGAEPDENFLLARDLTIAESSFFRNGDQFRALAEAVLPRRIAARSRDRQLQIVSLGCASGEEAYSLAIAVREVLSDPGWQVSILGVDVNPAVVDKARRGVFSAWSLRDVPPAERRRWFRTAGGREHVLDDTVRRSVQFEVRNLAADDQRLWQDGTYDIVFCRNVIMYFAPDQARTLVDRIARAIRPGGYLFLGHAETLRGLSGAFHLCHTHGTFYYQRRSAASGGEAVAPPAREEGASRAAADAWVDAIRRASDRVAVLTGSRQPGPAGTGARSTGHDGTVDRAVELMRCERFTEALELVDGLRSGDPAVLLLRAVLLLHSGRIQEAETECQRLLLHDELSAGAHHLLALCHAERGDAAAAAHHDRMAAHLDPGFAMPRLHLGLLARRAGATASARRDLEQALVLLQRESPSRVLLFGGGFSREGLVGLCTAELSRCGSGV